MSRINADPIPHPAAESTGPYIGDGVKTPSHERIKVALVSELRTPTGEIQTLLRNRLVIVAALFLLAGTLGSMMRLKAEPPVGGPLFLAMLSPFLVLAAVILAWLLRTGSTLSLRRLRQIELVFFGGMSLSMVAITATLSGGSLAWCAQLREASMTSRNCWILDWWCPRPKN